MTQTYDIFFTGKLTSQTPIGVTPPSAEEIPTPDGKGKIKRIAHRTIYRDGVRQTVPVLPGSSIRGRLRRSGFEVMRILDGGAKVPLDVFHKTAIGGVKGSQKEDAYDVVGRREITSRNPVIALFGAGDPWIKGSCRIEDAVPTTLTAPDLLGGTRTDDGKRDNAFFDKLTPESVEQWVKMTGANADRTRFKADKAKLRREISAARKSSEDAKIADLQKKLSDLEEAEKSVTGANPVSMPVNYEMIPAGTEFTQDIHLIGVTDVQAGLFIAALNHTFGVEPGFGAHASTGCGLLTAEYDVEIRKSGVFDPFTVGGGLDVETGFLSLAPYKGITKTFPALDDMMAAAKAASKRSEICLKPSVLESS